MATTPSLANYEIRYSGGLFAPPHPTNFGALGITAAKIVSVAGGADYAELTVAASVNAAGMPFAPLARHDIYNPEGALVFTGWLMRPGRNAPNPATQEQTFRLEGPMSQVNNYVFKQAWNYAINPDNYASKVGTLYISRVLLNRQDYAAGTRVDVATQIQDILDFAISPLNTQGGSDGPGAPIAYAGLGNIPELQPQEDEQTDAYCGDLLQRQLRMVPLVCAYWVYGSGTPTLTFSANAATTMVGGIPVVNPAGLTIDLNSGLLTSFKSDPRYDLLVAKVHVDYQAESDVTDDGTVDGNRKLWATLFTDESVAANGSLREVWLSVDLRGAAGPRDPTTGLQDTPQELVPVGLAAALHAPFKQLTHSLEWSVAGTDVEWTSVPGLAVSVENGGDDQLVGSRSIVQQITRDLATGTTSFQAGPATQLGAADLLSLMRFNRSRNAGRSSGGNAGSSYNQGGGPRQQNTGEKGPAPNGSGGGGPMLWCQLPVNGQIAYAQFAMTVPVPELPEGAVLQNPD